MIRPSRLAAVALPAALAAASLTPQASRSAAEKFGRIASEQLSPGAVVAFTEDEVNSYLRYDYAAEIPAGISQPSFRFEPDRIVGKAVVDFLEWQIERGASPGLLLRWLLRGKRPVEAAARYTSADGWGRADVEWARIGGMTLSGEAVHFLIEHLVRPRYPPAVAGQKHPLGHNLRQVRFERGRAVLVFGGQRQATADERR